MNKDIELDVAPWAGLHSSRSWEKVGHFRVCGTGVAGGLKAGELE